MFNDQSSNAVCPNCGCNSCGSVFIETDNVFVCGRCGTEFCVNDEGSYLHRKTVLAEGS